MQIQYENLIGHKVKLKKSRGPVRGELVLFESRVLRAGQTPACTQCAGGVLGAVVFKRALNLMGRK